MSIISQTKGFTQIIYQIALISTSSEGKICAIITGLEYNQFEKIVECIEDTGSEAAKQLKNLVQEKL